MVSKESVQCGILNKNLKRRKTVEGSKALQFLVISAMMKFNLRYSFYKVVNSTASVLFLAETYKKWHIQCQIVHHRFQSKYDLKRNAFLARFRNVRFLVDCVAQLLLSNSKFTVRFIVVTLINI